MRMLNRGVLNVPNVSFIDEDSSIKYLTDIKYDYVDLGLPSGLKWATCNVGATSPEQTGLYFAWGETVGYTCDDVTSGVRSFTWDEYKAGPAASISTDLTLAQDAAYVNLGGNWRMPTKAEYQELIDNCDGVWTDDYNGTGIKGCIFTSMVNDKSVFFPAAGECYDSYINHLGAKGLYWSASLGLEYNRACNLDFDNGFGAVYSYESYCGRSVRTVCE